MIFFGEMQGKPFLKTRLGQELVAYVTQDIPATLVFYFKLLLLEANPQTVSTFKCALKNENIVILKVINADRQEILTKLIRGYV